MEGDGDQDKQTNPDIKLSAPVLTEQDSDSVPPVDALLKKVEEEEEEEAKLQKEEEELKKTIIELKGKLRLAQRLIVERQDEVERLAKQLQTIVRGTCGSQKGLSTVQNINFPRVEETDLEVVQTRWGTYVGGVQTRWNAEAILPEEIWEMVLFNLTDLKDLQSCLKTCRLFEKILHRIKPKFLFPLIFPHICSLLDNDLILSCRQVCRDWNAGVDNFLENHPAHQPFDEKRFDPARPHLMTPLMSLYGKDLYSFSNRSNDLRQLNFVEKMAGHQRNPIVGRALTIEITVHLDNNGLPEIIPLPNFLPVEEANGVHILAQSQIFWNSLIRFLEVFGRHIWYLNLEFDRRCCGITDASMFEFLTKSIFNMMPHLRRLRMSGANPYTLAVYLPILALLPKAPQLETLHFGSVYHSVDIKDSVVEILIHKHYAQLKKLRVNWETWQHIFKSNLTWFSLIELHVDFFHDEQDLQDVIPIIHSRMPHLKKLTVSPGYTGDYMYDFSAIMKAVIGLSTTADLQVLRIITSKAIADDTIWEIPDLLFAPPSLKTLEMELDDGDYVDFHTDATFLLRFPFLENLIVFTTEESGYRSDHCLSPGHDSVSEDEDFDIETTRSQMVVGLNPEVYPNVYEADIWELLPRLKLINFVFTKQVFTRKGYERFRMSLCQNCQY